MAPAGLQKKITTFVHRYVEAKGLVLDSLSPTEKTQVANEAIGVLDLDGEEARAAFSLFPEIAIRTAPANSGTSSLGARLERGPKRLPADDHALRFATIMSGLEEDLEPGTHTAFTARWSELDLLKEQLQASQSAISEGDPRLAAYAEREESVLVEMQSMSKTLSGRLGDKKALDGRDLITRTYKLLATFIKEGRSCSIGRMRQINKALRPEPSAGTSVAPGRFRDPAKSKETAFLRSCVPHRYTAEAVQQFLFWFRAAESSEMHPIELAARTYQRFVSIHPFSDGNGRTARALMDWVLMKNGYPPAALEDAKILGYSASSGRVSAGMAEKAVEQVTAAIEREFARRLDILRPR